MSHAPPHATRTNARCTKTIKLSTGQAIPAVGLGTWQSSDEDVYKAVLTALQAGYRHIDTAAIYGNEKAIGDAIRAAKVPREELFITTKLWCTDHTRPQEALDASLAKLGLEYVDLYLMHWPVPLNPEGNHPRVPTRPDGKRDVVEGWSFVDTYAKMQTLLAGGKTRAIGVLNFSVSNLQKLLDAESTTVVPAANQIELHPYLPQPKLVQFCNDHGIVVEAYSPLGSTDLPLLKDATVAQIAAKHGVSVATVLISWAVSRDVVVLPKSVTPARIETNLEVVDLSADEAAQLAALHELAGTRRFVAPDWSPAVVFDSNE